MKKPHCAFDGRNILDRPSSARSALRCTPSASRRLFPKSNRFPSHGGAVRTRLLPFRISPAILGRASNLIALWRVDSTLEGSELLEAKAGAGGIGIGVGLMERWRWHCDMVCGALRANPSPTTFRPPSLPRAWRAPLTVRSFITSGLGPGRPLVFSARHLSRRIVVRVEQGVSAFHPRP